MGRNGWLNGAVRCKSQLMAVVMGQVGIGTELQKNGNKQFTSIAIQEPEWKTVERS